MTEPVRLPAMSPEPEYLSPRALAAFLSVSLRTAWGFAKQPGFPTPRMLGPRMPRWRRDEVSRWVEGHTGGTRGRNPRLLRLDGAALRAKRRGVNNRSDASEGVSAGE